jgi:hypothetical protein
MPYNEAQMGLFRAVAHGWNKPGCGCADKAKCSCSPTRSAARKMSHEGELPRQRKMANLLKGY